MDYKTRTFAASERAYGAAESPRSLLAERSVYGDAAFLEVTAPYGVAALHLDAEAARALAAHLLEIVGEEPAADPLAAPYFAPGDRVVFHGYSRVAPGVGTVSAEPGETPEPAQNPANLWIYVVETEDGRIVYPFEHEMGEYEEPEASPAIYLNAVVRVISKSNSGDHEIGDLGIVEVIDGDATRVRFVRSEIAKRRSGHGPTGRSWWVGTSDLAIANP